MSDLHDYQVSGSALGVRGLTKHYAATRALDDVSIAFRAGAVTGVAGHNGAGKSTLVRILAGLEQPDAGEISVHGEKVHFASPAASLRHGLAVIQQTPQVYETLTVAENIWAGREPRNRVGGVAWAEMRQRTRDLFRTLGVALEPRSLVATLSVADRQMIEVARAISRQASIVIMDEPTAALSAREVERLFSVVGGLREGGKTIVLIDHKLDELMAVCDEVVVLREGKVVSAVPASETSEHELADAIVGHHVARGHERDGVRAPADLRSLAGHHPPLLEVEGLGRDGYFQHISFSVRRGEILGIAGLIGSGRSRIAKAIVGLEPHDHGNLRFDGHAYTARSLSDAVKLGLAYVPEDRKHLGILPGMSVAANLTLGVVGKLSRRGVLSRIEEDRIAERYVERIGIRLRDIHQDIGELSGGNQQKVLLARWLAAEPSLLILDEPTQGIDIGVKAEIYEMVQDLAARGLGVIVISSEFPELTELCDRILVVRTGELVADFNAAHTSAGDLVRAAGGITPCAPGSREVEACAAENVEPTSPGPIREVDPSPERNQPPRAPGAPAYKSLSWKTSMGRFAPFALALIAVLAIGSAHSNFLTLANVKEIVVSAAIIAIVAVGEAIVILARQIDLSVGSMVGVVAYILADTLSHSPGLHPAAVILEGAVLGACLGGINATLVLVARIPAIIATLATLSVYRGVLFLVSNGGAITANHIPSRWIAVATGSLLGVQGVIWFALIVAVVFAVAMSWTRTGRSVYAVGANAEAARAAGIPPSRVIAGVFVLSGALCGLAGAMWSSQYGAVDSSAGTGYELLVLAAVVVGGVAVTGGHGKVLAAACGAVLLAAINNALAILHVNPLWFEAVYGFAILVAVSADRLLRARLADPHAGRRLAAEGVRETSLAAMERLSA